MPKMGEGVAVAKSTKMEAAARAQVERAPTRDEMASLLQSVAATARPRRSSLRALVQVLEVLQRCPWVEGELRMELAAAAAGKTLVQVVTEHGGVRERVLPTVTFPLPFEEVDWALAETPDLFAPLRLRREHGKLVFAPSGTTSAALRPLEVTGESAPDDAPTVKRTAYVLSPD